MNHLSDDQIYTLAVKVAADSDLTPEEAEALRHVTDCDECYHQLCCMIAMQEMTQNLRRYAEENVLCAVLRLTVGTVSALLDQAENRNWTFRSAPKALTGTRAGSKRTGAPKLTDARDRDTFVSYDPQRKLLVIQIRCEDGDFVPRASVQLAQGDPIPVHFEKREDVFRAQITDLPEGEYRIILEK